MLKIFIPLFTLWFVQATAQSMSGCIDNTASNYSSTATVEDYSCIYNATTLSMQPNDSHNLPAYLKETSGLAFYNNLYWTHNDDSSSKIYGIHPQTGEISDSIDIQVTVNDWEDVQYLDGKFYIGDFGNNVNGARTNLRVFRYDVASQLLDTVRFTYENQSPVTAVAANQTNFDCEAFLVTDSMLYLFTKQWASNRSELHKVPNVAGNQVSRLQGDFNSQGLITGASFGNQEIILVGYTSLLMPFLYKLKHYQGDQFLVSNKRRYEINLPFHQVEAVSYDPVNDRLAISNEEFSAFGQTIAAKFFTFGILDEITAGVGVQNVSKEKDWFKLDESKNMLFGVVDSVEIRVVDLSGREVYQGALTTNGISTREWKKGNYILYRNSDGKKARINLNH